MWMFLILLTVFIIGILLVVYSYSFDNLGIILVVLSGIWLVLHIICWSTASIGYNSHLAKREALIQTLENARQTKNNYELAAITSKVAEYNQQLALDKYQNTLFVMDDWIDDRYEDLEPIK